MNSVQLIGRLTKDLDLKYTQTGKAVATGTLAVNRRFKNAQGESEADFINIQIWDKSAENLANFTRKGSQIGVNGRIQTRNYENKEGQRVYVTEIVVENFTLLEKKSDNAPQQSSRQPQHQQAPDPFASHGESLIVTDDMLPF
ncbi:single-stranded DNA-binding protein [Candidatus Saccharibacteria bacterium]|nr:single-stranded DNA-binding protein [Candidatus Saccharibacteria bacterium]